MHMHIYVTALKKIYAHFVESVASHAHHRGSRSSRSNQAVVFPMCASEHEALSCVICIHDKATQILASGRDPLSPPVHVSCAAMLRDIITCRGRGYLRMMQGAGMQRLRRRIYRDFVLHSEGTNTRAAEYGISCPILYVGK
jgi:hypothetical protein